MKFNIKPDKFKLDKRFFTVFFTLFLMFFIMNSARWTYHNFTRVNFDEIGIVLNFGLSGTDIDLLKSFIYKAILRSLSWTLILSVLCSLYRSKKLLIIVYAVCSFLLVQKLLKSNIQLGSLFSTTKSNFYEQEYVNPMSADIKWKQHKNVLFIALESIEKVYGTDKISGEVLTPYITKLERNNISFENYNSISGLSHTIAAITGFTTGLPLFYMSTSGVEKMIGATGIGTLFKNAGYQTWSIFPATGKFSLKSNLMKHMGFDNIIDGENIRKNLTNPPKTEPFYGVDDGTMFEYSKPILQNIIKSKQPYFIFMETINTHCKGYFSEYCEQIGFRQETAEDIIKCDDKIVSDFVHWFKKQDPNAVIILSTDHSQHTSILMKQLKKINNRTLSNVFINANIFKKSDLSRPISAMDFFPTILESAGAEISGCKLGLGVSLSSRCQKYKTLRERFSDQDLEKQMEQKNDLYYKLVTGKEKK